MIAFTDFEAAPNARFGRGNWHCDDLADTCVLAPCIRAFLDVARAPADGIGRKRVPLFASHAGKRVRVTMASRFGDVGITNDLKASQGYTARVFIPELTDFGESP